MGEALRKRGGPIVELKLVLFGQVGSGKTRLLNRFVYARKPMSDHGGHDRAKGNANSNGNDGEEEEKEKEEKDIPPTVGASYLVKLINLYGTSVKCSLWDVSGRNFDDESDECTLMMLGQATDTSCGVAGDWVGHVRQVPSTSWTAWATCSTGALTSSSSCLT